MSEVIYDDVIRTETLDRGERVEMMVDIYESSDAVRNHERQQALQHTGSVSVKNRRHRAVQVCLWLLCVLLLTAVIVLCVYFTADRNHLLTHNYNLTKEKEKLNLEYTEILNQNRNLTKEREKLLTEYTEIINQNRILTEEKDKCTKNNETLNQKRNLTEENKKLFTEYIKPPNQNRILTKTIEKLHNDINELFGWLTEQDQCSENSDKWIYHNFSFYYISSEWKNWSDSREDCKQREADLMIINNKEEQEFMQNATAESNPFWIGLRKEEGVWKWADETILTTSFWIDKYPRSYNHSCARISSLGWSDFSCNDTFKWICEKRILKSLTIR